MSGHYLFFRAWDGFTDRFPFDQFNDLPDDQIERAVRAFADAEGPPDAALLPILQLPPLKPDDQCFDVISPLVEIAPGHWQGSLRLPSTRPLVPIPSELTTWLERHPDIDEATLDHFRRYAPEGGDALLFSKLRLLGYHASRFYAKAFVRRQPFLWVSCGDAAKRVASALNEQTMGTCYTDREKLQFTMQFGSFARAAGDSPVKVVVEPRLAVLYQYGVEDAVETETQFVDWAVTLLSRHAGDTPDLLWGRGAGAPPKRETGPPPQGPPEERDAPRESIVGQPTASRGTPAPAPATPGPNHLLDRLFDREKLSQKRRVRIARVLAAFVQAKALRVGGGLPPQQKEIVSALVQQLDCDRSTVYVCLKWLRAHKLVEPTRLPRQKRGEGRGRGRPRS